MALTFQHATMGLDGAPLPAPQSAAVHPFFTSVRDRSQPRSSSEGPIAQDPATHLSVMTPLLSAAVSCTNSSPSERQLSAVPSIKVHKPRQRSIGKTGSRDGKIEAVSTRQLQLISTDKKLNGQARADDVTSAEQKIVVNINDGDDGSSQALEPAEDLDVDLNEERRKRRRTSSPSRSAMAAAATLAPSTPNGQGRDYQMDLEEQLIKAAFGEETPIRKGKDEAPVAPEQRSAEKLPFLVKGQPVAGEGGHSNACLPRSGVDSPLAKVTKRRSSSEKVTPPKKMIKLRDDGKLASPKLSIEGAGRGRSRRKGAGQAKIGNRLVIISYGFDIATRMAFGSSISEILSGEKAIRTGPASKAPSPKAEERRPVSPKSTHPFFMGKAALQSIEKGKDTTKTPADSDAARANSRPMDRDGHKPAQKASNAADSWVGFGSSFSKLAKLPGSLDAIWPPQDMMHCRGLASVGSKNATVQPSQHTARKLKDAQVQISANDDVLQPCRNLLGSGKAIGELQRGSQCGVFPHPRRRLMTGPELQGAIRERLCSRPVCSSPPLDDDITSNISQMHPKTSNYGLAGTHAAITRLYSEIRSSLSPFDRFECENRDWAHKYAPQCAAEVLQQGPGLFLLRDWFLSLTINSVDSGNVTPAPLISNDLARKLRAKAKRKRRRADVLGDFVVSTDEEADTTDDIAEPEDEQSSFGSANYERRLPKLSPSSLAKTKAVIISGPHGCGKTASVFAVAQELGFEVFEINAGARRSGKDIVDRVGDMTRNHLVRQLPDADPEATDVEKPHDTLPDLQSNLQSDTENGWQSTVQSFFKASGKAKPSTKPKLPRKAAEAVPLPAKKSNNKQRQSLILLEEVDVLFEEDKQFWSTVLALLVNSKRPIVMTCTDESLLPVEEMLNCAALRLIAPPQSIAVDYLLLLAANEGHLLMREALQNLHKLQRSDLRATITQLQFYCQMALGDTKGGIEWMLVRSNEEECHNDKGEVLRVVSEGTFVDTMGTVPTNTSPSESTLDDRTSMLLDAHTNWELDVEDWIGLSNDHGDLISSLQSLQSLKALEKLEMAYDAFSAADAMPGCGVLQPSSVHPDATLPPLTAKEQLDTLEGPSLIQDISAAPHSAFSLSIALSIMLFSRATLFPHSHNGGQQHQSLPNPTTLAQQILASSPHLSTILHAHSLKLRSALSPLSSPSASANLSSHGPLLSTASLYSTIAALPRTPLALDIAPYCRSIALSDLRLEADRLRLSQLLSEGGGGGGIGGRSKQFRTTRASRAALEGGLRGQTRRERWWGRSVGYLALVKTCGDRWGEAASALAGMATLGNERNEGDEGSKPHDATGKPKLEGEGRRKGRAARVGFDGCLGSDGSDENGGGEGNEEGGNGSGAGSGTDASADADGDTEEEDVGF